MGVYQSSFALFPAPAGAATTATATTATATACACTASRPCIDIDGVVRVTWIEDRRAYSLKYADEREVETTRGDVVLQLLRPHIDAIPISYDPLAHHHSNHSHSHRVRANFAPTTASAAEHDLETLLAMMPCVRIVVSFPDEK
jgi:hypothetical protein